MLVRAAQSCRPAAQPAACVRAHQQKHTRFPFQNRSSRSHDHKTHNNIKTMNYDDFMKQFLTSSELRKLWASDSMDTDALVLPPPSWVQNVLKEVRWRMPSWAARKCKTLSLSCGVDHGRTVRTVRLATMVLQTTIGIAIMETVLLLSAGHSYSGSPPCPHTPDTEVCGTG
jgi:hypothetical protein